MPEKLRRDRGRKDLLDKAHKALDILIAEKDANCVSGRFGVVIVRDQSGHTGIRYIIDEAVFIS